MVFQKEELLKLGPHLLDQLVIKFLRPFALQKSKDLIPAVDEFAAIAPETVFGVGQRNLLWIFGVPGIFRHPGFLLSGFQRERWKRWFSSHGIKKSQGSWLITRTLASGL